MHSNTNVFNTETLHALQSLRLEHCALLAARMFIRALPLLSVYSEGQNKANFHIDFLGFWPAESRADNLKALFYSHTMLIELSQKKLPSHDVYREPGEKFFNSLDDAEHALRQAKNGKISFTSLARKNAFCRVHDMVYSTLRYGGLPYYCLNRELECCTEKLLSDKEALRNSCAQLEVSLSTFVNELQAFDLGVLGDSRRDLLCAKAISEAKRISHRLAFFSSVIVSHEQVLALSPDVSSFAEKALITSQEYDRFSDCVTKQDFKLMQECATKLIVFMDDYESVRINALPYVGEISLDFYVEYPRDLFEACLNALEGTDRRILKIGYESALIASILLAEALAEAVEDEQAVANLGVTTENFIDALERFSAQCAPLEITFTRELTDEANSIVRLTGDVHNGREVATKTPSCLNDRVADEYFSWLKILFESMNADVSAYTDHDLKSYQQLLYRELLNDMNSVRLLVDPKLISMPIWSSEAEN